MFRFELIAAAMGFALLLGTGFAKADELRPVEGQTISLGSITGSAYYTNDAKGAHLVATLSGADGSAPMRVIAVLAADQSITFSVPRNVGEPTVEVAFTRRGDRVFVTRSGSITN